MYTCINVRRRPFKSGLICCSERLYTSDISPGNGIDPRRKRLTIYYRRANYASLFPIICYKSVTVYTAGRQIAPAVRLKPRDRHCAVKNYNSEVTVFALPRRRPRSLTKPTNNKYVRPYAPKYPYYGDLCRASSVAN